jgi:hypothetical protein
MAHVLTSRESELGNPDTANSFIAFAFGHRTAPNGNHAPGPINVALAAIAKRHYERRPRPVFAQWEIAEPLASEGIPVQAIYPVLHPERPAEVEYLRSGEVFTQALSLGLCADPVLVVAHRHHLVRCAALIRRRNLKVVTVPDELPSRCDPNSGQLWTAGTLTNLVSEIISRLNTYWERHLYPNQPTA